MVVYISRTEVNSQWLIVLVTFQGNKRSVVQFVQPLVSSVILGHFYRFISKYPQFFHQSESPFFTCFFFRPVFTVSCLLWLVCDRNGRL